MTNTQQETKPQGTDLSRAFSEDGHIKTHVGGQALIEGIMMRGKYNWAVAVRKPDGQIVVEERDLASGKKKNGWLYWPLVRGCRAFVESLVLSFKALEVSSAHAYDSEGFTFGMTEEEKNKWREQDAKDAAKRKEKQAKKVSKLAARKGISEQEALALLEEKSQEKDASSASESQEEPFFGKGEMAISMVVGLLLGLGLFIVAPAVVANLIVGEYDSNPLVWNLVDGVLRVAIFIFYIWLIGRMKDIKRMFGYHGAEHKAIHCFEHGLPMTVENARKFPCLHVRCGTAFLIMVMIIAILVYTVIPLKPLFASMGVPDGPIKLLLVIVTRIVFMPLIAGISYEITVKWAGSHPENPLVKVILWPGMQMQYLTTNEPDDAQIECAIAAMQAVLDREEREEQGQPAA